MANEKWNLSGLQPKMPSIACLRPSGKSCLCLQGGEPLQNTKPMGNWRELASLQPFGWDSNSAEPVGQGLLRDFEGVISGRPKRRRQSAPARPSKVLYPFLPFHSPIALPHPPLPFPMTECPCPLFHCRSVEFASSALPAATPPGILPSLSSLPLPFPQSFPSISIECLTCF